MTASQGWLLRHLRGSSIWVEHLQLGQDVRGSSPLRAALRSGNLLN